MIRCPDDVAPQRREVHGGEFSIGRGQDNEWVVADPERHLSKKHCRLVYGVGDWELHDLSTNGTYLNQSNEPIGRGAAQKLRSGDRIKFGPYEIEVTIEDDDQALPDREPFLATPDRADISMPDPVTSRSGIRPYGDSRLPGAAVLSDAADAPILPADFDPLAPPSEPFQGPTDSDHVPALESAFRPPKSAAVIPDDWDVDLPGVARPPATARRPQMPPAAEAAAPAKPHPQPAAPTSTSAPSPSDTVVVAAFLQGVGLSEAALADPAKTLERIGAAVRATVNGLRQTLIARASIKDEFRIEQTMIRPTGNNPLKFSLDDDDALATLLGTGRRGSMPPEEAIAEAFDDLRLHELATVSAMQAAVRVLLAQFEPEAVERKVVSTALDIHPAQKKARAWEAFVRHHKAVTQALSDDFDSVFGKAFARAYEEAIEKLSSDRQS
jgi:type VI secretion system FHA domain protein